MRRGAWFLWLAGCDPATPCEIAAETGPTLTLGQGETSFSPVAPGDALVPERGPQGGQHVWAALRATGLAPGKYDLLGDDTAPQSTVWIVDAATEAEYAVTRQRDIVWSGDAAESETVGVRAVLDPSFTAVDDEPIGPVPVVFRAEVTDECGTTVEASVEATLEAER